MLASYPFGQPRHGGQIRAAGIARGVSDAGWRVVRCGIYPEAFFAADERGPDDIVLDSATVREATLDDLLFADLIAARHAASDPGVLDRIRRLLRQVRPEIVLLEQPWLWLPLREALKGLPEPAIIYSSQNIEWRMRPALYSLGLQRSGSDALVAATRALELELWRLADLVLSISDVEGEEIARESGREVVWLQPSTDVAAGAGAGGNRFAVYAKARDTNYAALLSSAYWPNLEGFFEMFPHGLGFLRPDEQIWIAGSLGSALAADPRYQDFQTINDTRARRMGYIAESEKADFLTAARCVLIPVRLGAGAKLKTADALASGRAVISTAQGIEGYGPLVASAMGRGVYVADDQAAFRTLVRRALREGLPGCDETIRASLSQQSLSERIGPLLDRSWRRAAASGELR